MSTATEIETEVTEESYPTIEEYSVLSPNELLLREIITRQLIVQSQGDRVTAVYHKSPTAELATAIQNIVSMEPQRDVIQDCYNRAVSQIGGTVEVNFATEPLENVLTFLTQIGQAVTLQQAPPDWPMEYQVFSQNQLNEMARNQIVGGFTNAIDFHGSMKQFGATYNPSPEVQEIATVTSLMVVAYLQKAGVIAPRQGVKPGGLWTPPGR